MAWKRRGRKNFRRKSRRGRFARKRKAFAARVKRVILRTTETKYMMGAGENVALYHDRGTAGAGALTSNQGTLFFNPWYYITKGDTVSQRTGDEVIPRGMALRLLYNAASDRPAQFLRLIVAVIPKVWSGVVMDGSNFDLLDAAGSNDTVIGMPKKEGVKVLYDRTYTMKTTPDRSVATEGDSRWWKKIYIRSKKGRKLAWSADGLLVNKPVGIWLIPYDRFSTLRTDELGKCSYTYKLYFKDP